METLADNSDVTAKPVDSKIYSILAIRGATMIFGPLAGGYMIYTNFKTFRDNRKAQLARIISLTALIFIGVMGLLYYKQMRGMAVSVVIGVGLIASGIASHFQDKSIAIHKEEGGSTFGFMNIASVSIVALIISIVLLFAVIMCVSPFMPKS